MRKTYHVEYLDFRERWCRDIGSEGNKSYAMGWFYCHCQLYPRAPHRMVDHLGNIIEQDGGAPGPSTCGWGTK